MDEQYYYKNLEYHFEKSTGIIGIIGGIFGPNISGTVKYLSDSNKEYDSFILYDFEVACSHSSSIEQEWIRYLYKVFGEEYKKAYLEECVKVFV